MVDGFLGRWSQRKQALREGRALEEVKVVEVVERVEDAQSEAKKAADTSAQAPPALTLEDVKTLNADSSFAPFVSRNVAPEVRNAAMKKLFTDPHFNVMDGLDIYIDDYSLASPLPATMLRQMVSAKFLKLFDADPPTAQADPAHAGAGPSIEDSHHDHIDLRLQPDDAARCEGLKRKPE